MEIPKLCRAHVAGGDVVRCLCFTVGPPPLTQKPRMYDKRVDYVWRFRTGYEVTVQRPIGRRTMWWFAATYFWNAVR